MGAKSTSTTLEKFQAEFSPRLDTSLIAAMVADYMTGGIEPSELELQTLRAQLSQLAAQAEVDEIQHAFADELHIGTLNASDHTTSADGDGSGHDIFSANEATSHPYTATTSYGSTCTSSIDSGSGPQPFSSPLGFLQTAFPHLPTSRLRSALGSSEDADEVDMEAVVEGILATEFVKELEERGLSDQEEAPPEPWQAVRKSKRKAKRKNETRIAFGDVRQQQHVRRPSSAPSTPRSAPLDPWTQVTSFSSRLSELLPSQPPSYFQSLFHSPKYTSPADALRAGLASMKPAPPIFGTDADITSNILTMMALDDLTDVECRQLEDDVGLSVNASLASGLDLEGAAGVALELVSLLRVLDTGDMDWGVYHSPAPASMSTLRPAGESSTPNGRLTLPSGPPSPPPIKTRRSTGPSSSIGSPKPVLDAWQTVPTPSRAPAVNPHAEFIPAYNPTARLIKSKTGRKINGVAKAEERKLDVMDPQWHRYRAGELMEERKEALVQASRAWKGGNAKTRGGEVALTYAERARALQEQALQESLRAAWDMVQEKRTSSNNGTVVDLHGTTVMEAIHIVEIVLQEEPPTSAKPLKIITGRGNHSINRVGVLGPAVQAALTSDGWNVAKWDGGLVVRGRVSR